MHQVGFKPRIPEFVLVDAVYASIEECNPSPIFLYLKAAFFGYWVEEGQKQLKYFRNDHMVV
jgi:hypothetical protein